MVGSRRKDLGGSDTGTGDWGNTRQQAMVYLGGKVFIIRRALGSMGLYLGSGEMAMGFQALGHCGGSSQGASWYIPQSRNPNFRKGHLGVDEAEL